MSKLEEYGYLLNKYTNNVKKFSSGSTVNIKSDHSNPSSTYIMIICFVLLVIVLYYAKN